MYKRVGVFFSVVILTIGFALLLVSCGDKKDPAAMVENTPAPAAADGARSPAQRRVSSQTLLGFIIPDEKDISLYTLKHGFLRTAENLGYPSKLYLARVGAAALEAVEKANTDGCAGLLIYNPGGVNDMAVARAAELSMPVVVPYHKASEANVATNVVADVNGYGEEIALGLAERMVERECKAGQILIYGEKPGEISVAFAQAIAAYYPQYKISTFTRTKLAEQEAIDELASYILWNRDIKGLFATDIDGTSIAVRAREKAQKDFKANGAPETKEDAISPFPSLPAANATPVPKGLVSSITITVAGYGFTDQNISLVRTNDIYAFILEPYYEASAQSVMLLDKILGGESVPAVSRLNMPIVRMATLDKYVLIHNQVLDWFAIERD